MKKNFAFTLAEVLITLAIIGVVAALTIPTLISKIEQKVLITSFKKIYANMNVALQATALQDNYGNAYPCGVMTSKSTEYNCTQFYNDYLKHLKLIKTEIITYLPYKDENKVEAEGGILHNAFKITEERNYTTFSNNGYGYYKYYLADGSVFYRSKVYYSVHSAIIIVDVNGDKAPNRWGYDVYLLQVSKKNNGAMYISGDAIQYMIEKGGMSAKDIIKK